MNDLPRTLAVAIQAPLRTAVIAVADADLRRRIGLELTQLRWEARLAGGGAEATVFLDQEPAEVLIVDTWLPDLEIEEFIRTVRDHNPRIEILRLHEGFLEGSVPTPRRSEVLLALRAAELPGNSIASPSESEIPRTHRTSEAASPLPEAVLPEPPASPSQPATSVRHAVPPLPEIVGTSEPMRELAWLIRLVAPRTTSVLIEGATGTGKELVAKAVHRLSDRAQKPFVVLNCAAIPESLLEAELFGHTRGAFTGAVQSRVGRVEAANGGTLFLDEIGEMPLALQAKMLRFLECGEIQRVGGNDSMRVDVRIVAATHQPLKQRAAQNSFRLDLYHRLAVFPVRVPSLAERLDDLPLLTLFFLERFGLDRPAKRLTPAARQLLQNYTWPGNIRELAHVLERATILAEDRPEITQHEIRL